MNNYLTQTQQMSDAKRVLAVFAHPTSQQILAKIMGSDNKLNVTPLYLDEVTKSLIPYKCGEGTVTYGQAEMSQRLRVLKDTRLVRSKRNGKKIYYSVNMKLFRLLTKQVAQVTACLDCN